MKIAFDYKAELNQLRFTPEEKASMTERLLSAAQKTGSVQKPRRRWKRSAVAAVAAVACLCVGAGAVGVTKLASDTFSPVFGSAETEIVDKIGHPIGASATAGGVTITADAIIGDKHHYAIAYTIEKNDGSAFDFDVNATVGNGVLPLTFEQQDTNIGLTGGSHGSSYFYDADPSDNAIQFVEECEVDGNLPAGGAVKAVFRNLYTYPNGDYENRRLLAKGKWVLKFDLDFEDTSVALRAGQTTTLNDMPITINAVTLSPLALRVDYTVGSAVQWEDAPSGRETAYNRGQSDRYLSDLTVLLTMKDGTVMDLTGAGGSLSPNYSEDVTEAQKGQVFDTIIDPADVESITVGGIVIPVDVS